MAKRFQPLRFEMAIIVQGIAASINEIARRFDAQQVTEAIASESLSESWSDAVLPS